MMTKQKSTQGKFNSFDWQVPRIAASLVQGEDAEALYNAFVEDTENNYHNHPSFRVVNYDAETKSMRGANLPLVSRLTELLAPSGIRTAVPADDKYGDVSRLIDGRFYADFNALVLRIRGDSYAPNDSLAKDLADKIEQKQGKLKLPVMVVRPIVRYAENLEYGFIFDLEDVTTVIEDERLDEKKYPTGMKFDNVDKIGLPLFDKKGKRTWYAREDGLSRLFLYCNLDLNSLDEHLADSLDNGRVVLVRGKAPSQKFGAQLSTRDKFIDDEKLGSLYESLRKVLGK